MLQRPRIAEALAWPAAEFALRGWHYRIVSEPDPVRFANIRFLAGYRRAAQFAEFDLEAVIQEARDSLTIGEAFRSVTGMIGDAPSARAVVLHLLWSSRLTCDLGAAPLNVDTPLVQK